MGHACLDIVHNLTCPKHSDVKRKHIEVSWCTILFAHSRLSRPSLLPVVLYMSSRRSLLKWDFYFGLIHISSSSRPSVQEVSPDTSTHLISSKLSRSLITYTHRQLIKSSQTLCKVKKTIFIVSYISFFVKMSFHRRSFVVLSCI